MGRDLKGKRMQPRPDHLITELRQFLCRSKLTFPVSKLSTMNFNGYIFYLRLSSHTSQSQAERHTGAEASSTYSNLPESSPTLRLLYRPYQACYRSPQRGRIRSSRSKRPQTWPQPNRTTAKGSTVHGTLTLMMQ